MSLVVQWRIVTLSAYDQVNATKKASAPEKKEVDEASPVAADPQVRLVLEGTGKATETSIN